MISGGREVIWAMLSWAVLWLCCGRMVLGVRAAL